VAAGGYPLNMQLASQDCGTLFETQQAKSSWLRIDLELKTDPIVLHLEMNRFRMADQPNPGLRSAGVAMHVGQAFLGGAVQARR